MGEGGNICCLVSYNPSVRKMFSQYFLKMLYVIVLVCLWHLTGVFGESVSVKDGDSVTLHSGLTKLMDGQLVQWKIGAEDTLIAGIDVIGAITYKGGPNERFRNRLKLDRQTGSLTISNIKPEHAGLYEIQAYRWIKYIRITVYSVFDKPVSVMEGDSVTLNSGLTETMDDDLIQGRDRLKVDQTGSMTITDVTTQHAGVHELKSTEQGSKRFSLTVNTRLPVPVLIFHSSSSSFSSQCNCSVVCSVMNVSAVSLSWYKGNSVLSSISVSDLSSSVSLHLEVEYQDNNTYSCVINNTISNQTTHLNVTQLCQPCSESVHCCGPTEAVIRLVVSALVGVASVAFLVYDIRFTRGDKQISEML